MKRSGTTIPNPLKESVFLKACRREETPYTPIWLMRQAGRYMKEYRTVRAQYGFLELCKNSDLACEVTVTAREKLGVDAAIIFSDILLVLEPMNVGLKYTEKEGPKILRSIGGAQDVLNFSNAYAGEPFAFLRDAIKKTRSALPPHIPLIGFAGAPFTLASYLLEGKHSNDYLKTKEFFRREPRLWHRLMKKITEITVDHINGQIEAGVQAVQIFDSWVGCLSPADYKKYVSPYMKTLFSRLRPGPPAIHFGTKTERLLALMRDAGGDVIGLDWRVNLGRAWKMLGNVAVQGNMDPSVLLSDLKTIRRKTKEILKQANHRPGHIFNLGHGVLPQTPVENVIALVDMVHEMSDRRPL